MSESDNPRKAPGPLVKDHAASSSEAPTESDIAPEGKRSRSSSRRARRRRQAQQKSKMPPVGEEAEMEQEIRSKSSTLQLSKQQKKHGKEQQGPREKLGGEEGESEITKKEGLKLRLELDLDLELELKARLKGSITLALLK